MRKAGCCCSWAIRGVGKTALLAGAAREARSAGMRVLAAAGRESERDLAFAGLHQLLRPVLDRLAGLPARQAEALRGAFALSRRSRAPLDALRAENGCRRAAGAQRIGLIGFSAGGHLAGLAALAPGAAPDETVQFAVLGYAITSMETETYRPARLILLGEEDQPAAAPADIAGFAGFAGDAFVAPVLRLAHRRRPLRPPEHTYRFAAALAASHVAHAVHVFPHGPHGLGLARDAGGAAIWTTLAQAWIHEQAPPPGRQGLSTDDDVT
jgi:dienelactone hydrolase